VVEAWKREQPADTLKVLIFNESAQDFSRALYSGLDEVELVPANSLIQLERRDGEIRVAQTLRKLRKYVEAREDYFRTVRRHLQGCNLTIDIGTPFLAHAAKAMGIPNITFFDHSWACTLRGICSTQSEYSYNPSPTRADLKLAEQIAAEIEKDERCTSEVILFDRYITPPTFRKHWERLGFIPRILRGVLGERGDPKAARETLNSLLVRSGQRPVAPDQKLALISPGGTPIWAQFLPRIIEACTAGPPRDYIPVLACSHVSDGYKEKMKRSDAIRWSDLVPGATLQAIIPAFALVVTRAGGGTVNDCLACKVPFVCVEERQWQVQLIERECKAMGLIPALRETSLDEFRKDPAGCIDTFVIACNRVPETRICGGAEKHEAKRIVSKLRQSKA
jgi:hypothetical protein